MTVLSDLKFEQQFHSNTQKVRALHDSIRIFINNFKKVRSFYEKMSGDIKKETKVVENSFPQL